MSNEFKGTPQDLVINPEEDLLDLIPGFLDNRRKDLVLAKQFLSSHEFGSLSNLGHTIKGVARPYGFDYLEKISIELENCALIKDLEGCRSAVVEMQYYLDHLSLS